LLAFLKRAWPLTALLICSALFVLFPEIDLISSGWFYDSATKRFPLLGQAVVERPYEWVPLMGRGIVLALLLAFALSFLRNWHNWRKPSLFLFFCLIVGPGLIVNALLKENWGRARPFEVTQFNGKMEFTRAWQITDQCPFNCSFVSGHASAAFVLMAPAFLFVGWRRKAWFAFGLSMGAYIGWVRMAQGGHFFSDVVLAGFAVYFGCWLVYWLMYRKS